MTHHAPYKIDKDIPIPDKRPSKYPFAEMSVGDSFFVAADKAPSKRVSTAVGNAAERGIGGSDRSYTVRRVDGGTRCWRVS